MLARTARALSSTWCPSRFERRGALASEPRRTPITEDRRCSSRGAHDLADACGRSGELHEGRFAVGVEVDASRLAGRHRETPATDRRPRLVHYVATPLLPDAHTPGSLENLCNANGAPGGVVFGWLYRVIAYTPDGRIVSDTHVCVPFPDQNDRSGPPPPPTLPEPPTIGEVWRAIQLPLPVVGANPVSRGVTGLTTRLWSGGAQTALVAATIDGFTVVGSARVVEYRFATDEGYLGAGGPGSASPGVHARLRDEGRAHADRSRRCGARR